MASFLGAFPHLFVSTTSLSNRNHIFYETNKHNPLNGRRAYLPRFEAVIFHAIQNIVF